MGANAVVAVYFVSLPRSVGTMPSDLPKASEVFLQPGEYFFGMGGGRIRTVLGSCVSLVFWRKRDYVGGMCHFMLPTRGRSRVGAPSGMYGDEAVELMLQEIAAAGLAPCEFQVRLYGGGDMFPGLSRGSGRDSIGQQNVRMARNLIDNYQLNCISSHVEGIGHRQILFDIATGRVAVRHPQLSGIK